MKAYFAILSLLLLSSSYALAASESLQVTHYQAHERYDYGAKLLDLALSKLNTPYQIHAPRSQTMNEARGELQVISGQYDLQWMSTSQQREDSMIPVKIPIYQGILGLRLLLVNRERKETFGQIKSLTELQRYTGGHGLHWGDLPVYAANNLKVVTHKNYDSIFTLLKLNRIDYFHRGLNEIWTELSEHDAELSIADNVMLFYPHPIYFFVSKHRPELATLLKKGLELALNDGSFEQLFLSEMSDFIDLGELSTRELIILSNPVVPTGAPKIHADWWLPEHLSIGSQ